MYRQGSRGSRERAGNKGHSRGVRASVRACYSRVQCRQCDVIVATPSRRWLKKNARRRACDVPAIVLRGVCPCAHKWHKSPARTRARAHTLANLALSREAKENARPAAAHVCRTGSVSIRPDPCGLLYSPQVLSFLPSFPRHAALVVYRLARSFFRSAVLAAERAVSLSLSLSPSLFRARVYSDF